MAWPWTAGEILTAENLQAATKPVNALCVVEKSPSNNVANNSFTTVRFNQADLLDPRDWHNTLTNDGERFVPDIAGWYQWTGFVQWSDVVDDDYTLVQSAYTINGVLHFTVFRGSPLDAARPIMSFVSAPFLMNGTSDYTEIQLFQTNTDADTLTADTVRVALQLVSPT